MKSIENKWEKELWVSISSETVIFLQQTCLHCALSLQRFKEVDFIQLIGRAHLGKVAFPKIFHVISEHKYHILFKVNQGVIVHEFRNSVRKIF